MIWRDTSTSTFVAFLGLLNGSAFNALTTTRSVVGLFRHHATVIIPSLSHPPHPTRFPHPHPKPLAPAHPPHSTQPTSTYHTPTFLTPTTARSGYMNVRRDSAFSHFIWHGVCMIAVAGAALAAFDCENRPCRCGAAVCSLAECSSSSCAQLCSRCGAGWCCCNGRSVWRVGGWSAVAFCRG